MQVQQKSQEDDINETDAVFVVYADCIINKHHNSVHEALFWVVAKMTTEFCVSMHHCILSNSIRLASYTCKYL